MVIQSLRRLNFISKKNILSCLCFKVSYYKSDQLFMDSFQSKTGSANLLPVYWMQKPVTSQHFHCCPPGPSHHYLLLDCGNNALLYLLASSQDSSQNDPFEIQVRSCHFVIKVPQSLPSLLKVKSKTLQWTTRLSVLSLLSHL